jgi:hypothetical protein
VVLERVVNEKDLLGALGIGYVGIGFGDAITRDNFVTIDVGIKHEEYAVVLEIGMEIETE